MDPSSLELPQLLEFFRQVIASCRNYAERADVPGFARERLRDAADHVEFFQQQRAYRRAFAESKRATALHAAVGRFLQAGVDAVTSLQIDLSQMR